MDWKSLGEQIAKIGLPLLGAILPIPGGAAIGTALAAHIGASSSDPADIFKALTASADAVQKAKEFEASNSKDIMLALLQFQQQTQASMVSDVGSARNLAEIDVSHGNAATSMLSALVRPMWGLGALAVVGLSFANQVPIPENIMHVIEIVLEFYFGGKIVEAITPHFAEALSRFAGTRTTP